MGAKHPVRRTRHSESPDDPGARLPLIRCRCVLIVAPEDDPTGERSSSRTR